MSSINVGDREVEHDQRKWSEVGRQRVQEPPKVSLFSCLPREAETDVERLHDRALSGQVGGQDRAVNPAAGEDGEGATAGHASPR